MSIKKKVKTWLITKIAGDSLVLVNCTAMHKYHPIFADMDAEPIIEKCTFVKQDKDVPFHLFDSKLFEIKDDNLVLLDKYKNIYDEVIEQINFQKAKEETAKEETKADA